MSKFVGLIELIDSSEDKKAKGTKKCVTKRKLKYKYYKNCLESAQLDYKIKHTEKNKINIDSVKKIIKNL